MNALDVEFLQLRWHSRKHHGSKYGGRSAASSSHSGGRRTFASVGRSSIGRFSGTRRQMIGVVKQLSSDDRSTKGHRPIRLLTVAWLLPDVWPSVGYFLGAQVACEIGRLLVNCRSTICRHDSRRCTDHQSPKIIGRPK